MDNDKWFREARRYAHHIYGYAELIDDSIERFDALCKEGIDPYAAVEAIGERYDLTRVDGDWGIHQNEKFERML